jgi:MHS family proline/betaine transporter-like MFS transporter
LALGGEYGGAATYVAEHAPANRRGFWTSWIQTTATLGLFLALGVIILIRSNQGVEAFSAEWGGWRYPFWMSIVLVGVSIVIRMKMSESPMFTKLKSEGKTSTNPLKESFGHKANFKMVLLALFGAVMGQGVIWYTGQFYAQSFIETVCKVEFVQSRNLMLWAILFATPFFVVFGYLSDRIGRKWIMMFGMLAGILTYRPIYQYFLDATNAKNRTEKIDLAHTVVSEKLAIIDEKVCTKLYVVQKIDTAYTDGAKFSYTKTDTLFLTDIVKEASTGSIYYTQPNAMDATKLDTIVVKLKPAKGAILDASKSQEVTIAAASLKPNIVVEKTLDQATYWNLIWLVFLQILYVTMVYGPIAAFLVELFPTKIRYTSMSLPYHIGNGVFGGLVPFLGTLIVEFTKTADNPAGDPLAGLWYPIGVASICLFIGVIYLTNKVDKEVMD